MLQSTHIRILMCTHNGADHVEEQLASFLGQSHDNWSLWISDDRSTDETPAILARFRDAHPGREIRILRGPGQGGARNFMTLLAHPDLDGSLVALSDQDDVWLPDKLARAADAMALLQETPVPAAYGAGWYVTDEALRVRRRSRPIRRGPSFANAMVQNILSGHSLVLNSSARQLIVTAGQLDNIRFQDWWIYLLVTGAGGRVIIDEAPVLYYRQHSNNMIGTNIGVRARCRRLAFLLSHEYGHWIRDNARALIACGDCLLPENRQCLHQFLQAEGRGGIGRMRLMRQLGIHRQNGLETLVLMCAAALNYI